MEIIKKHKAALVIALVVVAVPLFLFIRFYHNDTQALADYSASYGRFDQAISDFSTSENQDADLKSEADDALVELKSRAATFRLSSLVENDGRLMNEAREVADLSGKELDSLKVYESAVQSNNAQVEELAKEYVDLTGQRKAAFARFRELAGLKD
jgi:hypothetical protein